MIAHHAIVLRHYIPVVCITWNRKCPIVAAEVISHEPEEDLILRSRDSFDCHFIVTPNEMGRLTVFLTSCKR